VDYAGDPYGVPGYLTRNCESSSLSDQELAVVREEVRGGQPHALGGPDAERRARHPDRVEEVIGEGEEGGRRSGPEVDVRPARDLLQRGVVIEGGAVRAIRGHRVVAVGHREQLREQRDVVAPEPLRVAAPVPA